MKKILIVEDEKDMVTGLKFNLEARDYTVIAAYDGETGYQMALEEKPDLVILDLMLPKLNGYEVCKILKKEMPNLLIIMLTAKSQEAEIVTGLELGADDYVTKPYSARELTARIRAVTRRSTDVAGIDSFVLGGVRLDADRYELTVGGEVFDLPRKEFEVMALLLHRAGRIVTRDRLLDEVWGMDWGDTKSLDQHIRRLRRKLEQDTDAPRIVTIRGVGYRLEN